ncbi:pre-B-cell leukemia homeobox interacting protein 1b isoform X2 [Oryzias melastigma]|uniref:pre-B-cell leukemia homeobox interacting protein 1b isoform X2 n=1 Tax=Oryzias melastigma TaxID=30732 RepID=UPI000CF7B39E|nr:pre-B-cell leukemia homeobox interacting protein 1b isoform X2 [Oryzias melastigma]
MSGSSSSNSWTILSSEESAAETLRPVAADTQQRDTSHASTADEPHCEENHKPPNGAESAEGPPVEDYLISKGTSDQSGDLSSDHPSSSSTACSRDLIPPEGLSESPAQFTHSPTLSSDPQTLSACSTDEPTSSLLGTETLGSAEFTQGEKSKGGEGLRLQNEEHLHQEDGGPDHSQRNADSEEGAASHGSPDVGEEGAEKTREVGEQKEEEKRRKSLLSALEQIGRREEEEEEEEEFQMPQREDDSVLSLNKCILGAVILLGIGTIFFSGVLMDLDGEGDHVTREMRDADAPGKQEWLSPEALPPLVDADGSELLKKLAKGNQQISVLQAQLQAQNEELKVARGQAAEGAKERQRWEEVEKENSRLKTEMASLPVLQNENERMKKELESVPALQKELETLRSTVTELRATKSSSSPPTGQPAERSQASKRPWEEKKKKDFKSEKFEASEKKQQKKREKPPWKEEEKPEPKDGNRWEWNKWKQERGRSDEPKERVKRQSDGTQQRKGKDEKKEKADRGEEGKLWKEKVGEKREWMEKKEWKKEKHVNQDKQRETKEWKGGKDRRQKHRETQESEAENEQMKGKDGIKKSGKEWKEKGDKKEYGCRDTSIKNRGTEGKGGKHREDRKNGEGQTQKKEKQRWNEYERKSEKQDKEWKGEKTDQRKKREENWKSEGVKEKKRSKDKQHSGKNGNEHKPAAHEHLYGEQAPPPHTHHKPPVGQPEYWARQKTRLQHDPRAPQHCDSPEACAQAERLRPVPLAEFEAVLQNYLVKAQEAGVEESNREELRKLASDFFKDGVFMHTQMSFQSFAEDVADILEDFVDFGHEGEEDSELEDEMEGFEREVMEKFSVEAVQEKEERIKGQQRNRG